VSSGDLVRHRLCRAGDRQLNRALHVMAITQIRGDTDGKAYYQRKRQAGKSHREALRCSYVCIVKRNQPSARGASAAR
jgi:transposase